jgi:hypothetical protein
MLAAIFVYLILILLPRTQLEPKREKLLKTNKKIENESITPLITEHPNEVSVKENIVEIEFPVKTSADGLLIEKPSINIKESKVNNGLDIEITIPNFNTESVNSTEIHSLQKTEVEKLLKKNKKIENENITPLITEQPNEVSGKENIVEIEFPVKTSTDGLPIEKRNINIKESKVNNGLNIEITIPNFNTEPINSAEIHSIQKTEIETKQAQNHSRISISKVSLSKISKSNCVFLLIKDDSLTIMDSRNTLICEEWKYRQPSSGSDLEELISSTLFKSTLLYYADNGNYEEILNEIINRLNSVTTNITSKLKTCNLFTAYKSFLKNRSFKFTYITNVLKNEGLLDYGKQPDNSTIYCERIRLLKVFLESNTASLSIVGDGINSKCILKIAYSNIINELENESIITWDYDRLYFKRTIIGKVDLDDSETLYQEADLLYLKKGKNSSPHKIIAIKKSHPNYLYFLDKRTHQYHSDKNKKNILNVKKSLMSINVPKFEKKTFQVTADYLSETLIEDQTITIQYLSVQHYLKQEVFRVNFTNSNEEIVISTNSCSMPFIDSLRLCFNCNHEVKVVNIINEKVKLVIINLDD